VLGKTNSQIRDSTQQSTFGTYLDIWTVESYLYRGGFPMRLLDLVAQCREQLLVLPGDSGARPIELSGVADFAPRIGSCPLRFVLADELTRACAQLAFSDGDRLTSCLDLIRIPAPLLWVEWSDAVHQAVITECGTIAERDPNATGRRVGVLLRANPRGRSGMARTFWSVSNAAAECEAQLSPVETHINLEDRFETADLQEMFHGRYATVTDTRDPAVADLLQHIRFRFNDRWLKYYVEATRDAVARASVARKSLASVACDLPLLLAFFLLLNAKGATRTVPIQRDQLNRRRLQRQRAPLLDHIEVHASLPDQSSSRENDEGGLGSRRPPRLHHVRGHLVRREDRIFWRIPHLRGHAHQGLVRSRTVCLSFEQIANAEVR
jgi:hypothetical protein